MKPAVVSGYEPIHVAICAPDSGCTSPSPLLEQYGHRSSAWQYRKGSSAHVARPINHAMSRGDPPARDEAWR